MDMDGTGHGRDVTGRDMGEDGMQEIRIVAENMPIKGDGFGESSYSLYDVCSSAEQSRQAPYLFTWLHGMGGNTIKSNDLVVMQRRLCHRTLFLVPLNPMTASDGHRFFWGVRYTKPQNKNNLGHVYGELRHEFLDALISILRQIVKDRGVTRSVVAGYSMGGFGAYQVGGHAPDLFDAVIAVAGYPLGSKDPQSPQPASSEVMNGFIAGSIHKISGRQTEVIVVHAQKDKLSSFLDAQAIVQAIQNFGGTARLVRVPDESAGGNGHNYFNYALLSDSSEEVVWNTLRLALLEPRRCRVPLVVKGSAAGVCGLGGGGGEGGGEEAEEVEGVAKAAEEEAEEVEEGVAWAAKAEEEVEEEEAKAAEEKAEGVEEDVASAATACLRWQRDEEEADWGEEGVAWAATAKEAEAEKAKAAEEGVKGEEERKRREE